MYVVTSKDAAGHEGRALEASVPLDNHFTRVGYTTFTNQTVIKPGMWQMAGICGLSDVTPPGTDSMTGSTVMYRWDESADTSKLYSLYVPVTSLPPGKGAWIYASLSLPLSMTPEAFTLLAAQKAVTVTTQKGWNQIASPYPYEVSPNWLGTTYTTWEWIAESNMYVEAKSMKPWKSYWVKSDAATDLTISAVPSIAQKRRSTLTRGAPRWEISLSLTGSRSSDPHNYIGTLPEGTHAGISRMSAEPPQAFDFPHLYLIEGNEQYARLYAISSAVPERTIEWKVGISASPEPMRVTIDNLSSVPSQVHLFWVDDSRTIDLRRNSVIELAPHAETTYGRIIALTNPGDVALYSGGIALRQNVPNPFSRTTVISYTVPYAWNTPKNSTTQKISLDIFDVSGRLVATLVSGRVKPGHYRSVWDGNNNKGTTLPSGVYIACLSGSNHSKTIRMFKVK
jgi:hypothetical protein